MGPFVTPDALDGGQPSKEMIDARIEFEWRSHDREWAK